jgi:photosystem II stability/assembly factor-like uncharacterized protein
VGIGAFALLVIAAAGLVYLRSTAPTKDTTTRPSVDRLLVTSNPVTYDFVSATTGWAILGSAGRSHLFRTTDGARHWQPQSLGGESIFPVSSSVLVHLFGKGDGFMAIGQLSAQKLYRTNDGGAHWAWAQLPDPQVEAVTFSDPTHGWLMAGTNSGSSSVYATSDGAMSWQRLPDSPIGAYGLSSRRAAEIWTGSFGWTGPPRVSVSNDGGASWRDDQLPSPPAISAGQFSTSQWDTTISLLPGVGVLASALCGCVPGGPFMFTSFDAGATWTFVPSAPGLVAFQDDFHWWAITAGTLYKSGDAGLTWTKVSNQLPEWQFVPYVLDSKHAWAELTVVGGQGLALTNDGGLHWTRADVPQSS